MVKDSKNDLANIYSNLHPIAKAYVDKGTKLYQNNPKFAEDKYVMFEKSPSEMTKEEIWAAMYEDSGYNDLFLDGYEIINTFDKGKWRYVTVLEKGSSKEIKILETFSFRKSGDKYLFYPPGWVMELYSPLEAVEENNPVLNQELLEAVIQEKIVNRLSEEDIKKFKEASSPQEVSEIFSKLLESGEQSKEGAE